MDYSIIAIACMIIACFIIGLSKTSIGGLGILAVPLMAYGFGAKPALGILLPIIVFADIYNVWIYRGICHWKSLLSLLPTTVIGVIVGYCLIDIVPNSWFTMLIGLVIILMLMASFFSEKFVHLTDKKAYGGLLGSLVGLTSIIANSAGTLVGMYFLQYNLEKRVFVSTRNHFFVILNAMKVPFIASLGLITADTLVFNLYFIPVLFIGSWVGLKILNLINMKMLKRYVQLAAFIAGVRMIFVGFSEIIA